MIKNINQNKQSGRDTGLFILGRSDGDRRFAKAHMVRGQWITRRGSCIFNRKENWVPFEAGKEKDEKTEAI